MRLLDPLISTLAALGGNPDNLSISGFSLGGYMAEEMGVIFSSKFKGVGIIGGGIYGIEGIRPEN